MLWIKCTIFSQHYIPALSPISSIDKAHYISLNGIETYPPFGVARKHDRDHSQAVCCVSLGRIFFRVKVWWRKPPGVSLENRSRYFSTSRDVESARIPFHSRTRELDRRKWIETRAQGHCGVVNSVDLKSTRKGVSVMFAMYAHLQALNCQYT